MACGLANIHDRSVLVADIASRNFLLDANFAIKFCDFSEASLLPLDTDMDTAQDDGWSVQTDIGELGAVFYEVLTGERCKFDLLQEENACRASWPSRDSLPNIQGIWLESIIEKCWTEGAFRNARQLVAELNDVIMGHESTPDERPSEELGSQKTTSCITWHLEFYFKRYIPTQPTITLAVTIGAITLLGTWAWRRA